MFGRLPATPARVGPATRHQHVLCLGAFHVLWSRQKCVRVWFHNGHWQELDGSCSNWTARAPLAFFATRLASPQFHLSGLVHLSDIFVPSGVKVLVSVRLQMSKH